MSAACATFAELVDHACGTPVWEVWLNALDFDPASPVRLHLRQLFAHLTEERRLAR